MSVQFLASEDALRFAKDGTDAYRIFVAPGAWGERWGRAALISYLGEADLNVGLDHLDAWAKANLWQPQQVWGRQLVKQPAKAPHLLRGADWPRSQVIREHGLKYEIDFSVGYSIGFFYDQRSNREFLIRYRPKKLLNCFAYTCAFSVAAASGGSQTMNVDLSSKALMRGRANFLLNNIALVGHRFLADDVFSVLKRLAHRGEKYDCIILDPPTFSRRAKKTFQVKRDFAELLEKALLCTAPKSHILLSTNCLDINISDLKLIGSRIAAAYQISASFHYPKIPCDILGAHSPSTLWMELV
ncbi:MAG: hypothetical protein C5B47_08530 [Verrucomicrobia bacterium]|nr:MAG: hypothetical protein C5B47_08530 [Verrucomicrobiota bacterium]